MAVAIPPQNEGHFGIEINETKLINLIMIMDKPLF